MKRRMIIPQPLWQPDVKPVFCKTEWRAQYFRGRMTDLGWETSLETECHRPPDDMPGAQPVYDPCNKEWYWEETGSEGLIHEPKNNAENLTLETELDETRATLSILSEMLDSIETYANDISLTHEQRIDNIKRIIREA